MNRYPVDYVNNPHVIAQNDRVISVSSTIEMDLTGACNSEYVKGHQYSASGGQLDFVRGAYASRGGLYQCGQWVRQLSGVTSRIFV